MEPTPHPFVQYAEALLPFYAPQAAATLAPSPPLDAGQTGRAIARMLRTLDRGSACRDGQSRLLLLGLGEGFFAKELARALPPQVELVVAELSPEKVQTILQHRRECLEWLSPEQGRHLLADTSPWALLLLLHAFAGVEGCTALRNPEITPPGGARIGLLQKLLTLAREERIAPPSSGGVTPSLSIGAILRPDEPGLDEFFAQFPAWAKELAVVWDADELPSSPPYTTAPLVQKPQPLAGDFGAQRNAMLSLCRGDWVLYLDADERLPAEFWELLPKLLARRDLEAFWLPRRTFYPDKGHILAGMGLWPDLQLRLFRNRPGLRFVNRVHERLQGVEGAVGILAGQAIRHLNQVLKTPQEIEAKYALFNATAGHEATAGHRRSKDYPRLPAAFFEAMEQQAGGGALLRLRYNPG